MLNSTPTSLLSQYLIISRLLAGQLDFLSVIRAVAARWLRYRQFYSSYYFGALQAGSLHFYMFRLGSGVFFLLRRLLLWLLWYGRGLLFLGRFRFTGSRLLCLSVFGLFFGSFLFLRRAFFRA